MSRSLAGAFPGVVGLGVVVLGVVALGARPAAADCMSVYSYFCGHEHDGLVEAELSSFDPGDGDTPSRARFEIRRVVLDEGDAYAAGQQVSADDAVLQWWSEEREIGADSLLWLHEGRGVNGLLLDAEKHPAQIDIAATPDELAPAIAAEHPNECAELLQEMGLEEPPCNDVIGLPIFSCGSGGQPTLVVLLSLLLLPFSLVRRRRRRSAA